MVAARPCSEDSVRTHSLSKVPHLGLQAMFGIDTMKMWTYRSAEKRDSVGNSIADLLVREKPWFLGQYQC